MNKIILVDDEIRVLKQLKKIIPWNELGFEIAGVFRKGTTALEFIKENTVDAIITDIKMPDISGLELAKICHKHYPLIKILIISAYDDFSYAKEALKYNISDYIVKPISKDVIINSLNSLNEQITINKKTVYSDKYINKKSELFSEIYRKNFDCEKMENDLSDINVFVNLHTCESALIMLNNEETEACIKEHNYDFNQFILILSRLILQETKYAYASAIVDENNSIKILLISKQGIRSENFFQKTEEYIAETKKTVSEILKLNLSFSPTKYNLKTTSNKSTKTNEAVLKAIEYINNNYQKHFNLDEIASYVCVTPSYLSDIFKTHTNYNITDYTNKIRIEKAQEIIENTDTKLSAVSMLVGFNSTSYFYRVFKNQTGYSPNDYKMMFKRM